MRPTNSIEDILGTRGKLAVLRVLHGVRVPLNAAQIAARTGMSWPAVSGIVHEFAEMGIVNSSSAGRANIHSLSRGNIYVTELLDPLFDAEERIPDEMLAGLKAWFESHAVALAVFGSHARGDQERGSDVDVAIVAAGTSEKDAVEAIVDAGQADFLSRYGAPLSAIVYDTAEAASLAQVAPAFAADLMRDAVVVFGPPPYEWSTAWRS
ncbi:MAG: nucleotidyltransferase domain-containing protein [Coriobacteriia bacterium]|nr:nucleotidyltransferase domain-containing protein [Coriobacteriia bacterium]